MYWIVFGKVDRANQGIRYRFCYVEKKYFDFKVLHDGEVVIGEILVGIVFGKGALSKKVKGQPLSIALAESTVEIFHRSRSSSNLFWSLFFG